MELERLKMIKENIMSIVQAQVSGNLQNVDAEELGKAVDMIKDLSEAAYYCSIVDAMEKGNQDMINYDRNMREKDREYGRMYYRGYPDNQRVRRESNQGSRGPDMNYRNMDSGRFTSQQNYQNGGGGNGGRDSREGRSGTSRRYYMEAKEQHRDKEHQMRELEAYMMELANDLTEMIQDASKEEKALLQQKLTALTQKIA